MVTIFQFLLIVVDNLWVTISSEYGKTSELRADLGVQWTPTALDRAKEFTMDEFDDFDIGPQADEFAHNDIDTDDLEDIADEDDTLYDEDEVEDDSDEISRYEDGWEDADEDDNDYEYED